MLEALLFYFFSLLALGGGILMLTRRSVVVSGVWLIVSLLGVAGLFLLQGAEFLFVSQLILYIGGVVLLFLIALMLINPETSIQLKRFRGGWFLIVCLCAGLAAELTAALARTHLPAVQPISGTTQANTEALADALFSHYLVPFELASIVLLAAIVGAVVMGQKREEPRS